MASKDPRVKELIEALESAEAFSASTYINRLHDQALLTPAINFLTSASTPLTSTGSGASDLKINDADHSVLIARLANQSAALALSGVSKDNDPKSLQGSVNKDKAHINMQDSLCRLAQACYADHLNSELRKKDPKLSLEDLKKDSTFLEAFKARLSDPKEPIRDFYKSETLLHPKYGMHMVFVANYLFNDYEALLCSADKMWERAFADLMGKILAFRLEDTKDHEKVVRSAVQAVSINLVKNEGGKLQPVGVDEACRPFQAPLIDQSVTLTGESLDKAKSITLSKTGFENWASTAAVFLELWEGKQGDWQRAIGSLTNQKLSTTETKDVTGTGSPESMPIPMYNHVETTWTGKKVHDWLSSAHKDDDAKDFLSEPNQVIKDTKSWTEVAGGSCFVAGTQITTVSGSRSIELLAENDTILTRGSSNEWGVVSDEKVVTTIENPVLYGFNGGKTFFTAGHVFHTTTGLRAVDPSRATKENPWMQPGRLLIGHSLLRWDAEANVYERITIESLHCEQRPDITEVYGVHLREGLRSYHANGYLVAVNYPEITIKSIARIMSTLTPQEQTQCLLAFQELRPILERFGIEGAGNALRKQLVGHSEGISAQFYDQVPSPKNATRCSQMKRVYTLSPDDELSSHVLPSVVIREGILTLDGDICEAVAFSDVEQQIRWTRQVPSTGYYEHCLIDLADHALSGVGVMALTPDYKTPLEDPATEMINFSVSIETAVNHSLETGAYVGVSNNIPATGAAVDGVFSGAEVEEVEEGLQAEGDNGFEDPPAYALESSDEPNMLWVASEKMSSQQVMNEHISLSNLRAHPIYKPLEFPMSFDAGILKRGQATFKDEQPFGMLGMSTFRETKDDMARALITVGCLDRLLQDINKANAGTPLDALYDTTLISEEGGATKGTVTVLDPALLANLADDIPEDDADYDGHSRTYKTKLNSDVVIPIIFKELEIRIDMDEFTAQGHITEFNPANKNHLGYKHYLAMNTDGHIDPSITGPRREEAGKDPQPVPVSPSAGELVTKLDLTYLTKMVGYDDNAVHMRSRDYLRDMMYYHMEADLRGPKFLNVPQPTNLPLELSSNLEDKYRNWIRDVYAPAYLTYMFSETNTNFREKYRFTDKEKAKIAYWWTGTDKKCLSSQPEYQALNKLCARFSMLSLHKDLHKYINDDGPAWATKLRKGVGKVCVYDLMMQSVTSKQNRINMYSNVLYALDPTGMHIQDLYTNVKAAVFERTVAEPGILTMPEGWLYDVVEAFVEELLSKKTDMDQNVKDALVKDMEHLTQKTFEELQTQHRSHAAKMMTESLNLVTEGPQTLHAAEALYTGVRHWDYTKMADKAKHNPIDLRQKGGKAKVAMMAVMLIGSIAACSVAGVPLKPAEKAQIATDLTRQGIEILTPFLKYNAPVPAATMEIEMTSMNLAIRQGAGNMAANPVVANNGAAAVANVQDGLPRAVTEIGKKRTIATNVLRGAGLVLGFAFVAFQCWDLAEHWEDMSGLQQTFGVLQAICTFVVVVCELLAWIFPAVACIPVVGAIVAIVGLLITIAIVFWVGDRKPKEPDPTEGEKFVEKVKNGLLTGWAEVPEPKVTYAITSSTRKPGQLCTIQVTGTNKTGRDLKLVPQDETNINSSEDSSDKWSRLTLSVAAGSDAPCWFSTSNFTFEAGKTLSQEEKNTEGKAYLETNTPIVGKLLTPSGKRDSVTTYDLAATAPTPATAGSYALFKAGESFVISMVGIVNKAGDSVLQLTETRPGVIGCIQKHTWARAA